MEKQNSKLTSFINLADDSLFPLDNLPYGVFSLPGMDEPHIGTAIGDYILDLTQIETAGLFKAISSTSYFNQPTLNFFAAQTPTIWHAVRSRLQSLLSKNNEELQSNAMLLSSALIPQASAAMHLPFKIEGFTDFYASEHHATNVGKLFRGKENALLPNWKYLPVGYNGRASTIFLSGTPIKRPKGQIKLPEQEQPLFTATKKLDFELEIGMFIGKGNDDGKPITIANAANHLFGLVLLNDWSARDIQSFEYQPLGPFLSKSFATSISAWVVPMAAFNNSLQILPTQMPTCVEYLQQSSRCLPNIKLKVELQPHNSAIKTVICETNMTELYWSLEQILAHHTVNNCIMRPGDLLGTGTISGSQPSSWGSLLELTFNATQPLTLPDNIKRTFLEDDDTVIFSGYAETNGRKIGLGSLEAKIISTK